MLPVLPLCIRREAHHRWRKRDQQGCSTVQYIDVRHWPLRGGCKTLGFPDASYRNNADNSSQRAHAIFIAEDQQVPDAKAKTKPDGNCRGAIVDYEPHKGHDNDPKYHGCGTSRPEQVLWYVFVSPWPLGRHCRRSDPNSHNFVTTAQNTHRPKQKGAHQLIQMLRHESNTRQLHDLSHVASEYTFTKLKKKNVRTLAHPRNRHDNYTQSNS